MLNIQVPTIGDIERCSGRNNNFLLIRLIAASAVIYGHAYAISPAGGCQDVLLRYSGRLWSGGIAVLAFFAVSGFLVTASYAHRNNLIEYLTSRALRIFPALTVCLLLTTFLLGPLVSSMPLRQYLRDPQTWDYYVHNQFLIEARYFLPGIFPNNPNQGMNGPLWSLFLESRLYLAVAALGLLGLLARRRLYNTVMGIVIVIGVFEPGSLSFLISGSNDLHCALLFAVGSLMYVNREYIPLHAGIVGLLLYLTVLFHGTDRFMIAFSGLLTYGLIWLAYVPKLPWFQRMGDYSYGVYIYGWPVAQVVKMLVPAGSPVLNAALALPLTLALAALSWRFVERPALSLKGFMAKISLAKIGARLPVRLHLTVETPLRRWICQLGSAQGQEVAHSGQSNAPVMVLRRVDSAKDELPEQRAA